MRKVLLPLLCASLVFTGCDLEKDIVRENSTTECKPQCCQCCSSFLKEITLNLENFNKYFKINNVRDEGDGTSFLYSLSISPVFENAIYDVSIQYKTISAIGVADTNYNLTLYADGSGQTKKFLFNYSGPLEEFNGIEIFKINGICTLVLK